MEYVLLFVSIGNLLTTVFSGLHSWKLYKRWKETDSKEALEAYQRFRKIEIPLDIAQFILWLVTFHYGLKMLIAALPACTVMTNW